MKNCIGIIILVGMPGSGKSTIGKKLSEELEYSYFDVDNYIEECENMTIPDIFRLYGEDKFRELEKNVTQEVIPELKNTIVSTGGGLPIFNGNMETLKNVGCVIYLKEDSSTIYSRVKNSNRPLAKDRELEVKIKTLYKERHLIYQQSDYTIKCSLKNEKEIVSEMIEIIKI